MALVNTDTKIIDTDSHLTEDGPRLVDGVGRWQMDGRILNSTTIFAQGSTSRPEGRADVDPACYDGASRLHLMDGNDVIWFERQILSLSDRSPAT